MNRQETSQLRRRLAAADPAADLLPIPAPERGPGRTPAPHRGGQALWKRLAPVAAGAVALTVGISLLGPGGSAVSPATAAILNRAAEIQPVDPPARPDQVIRVDLAYDWGSGPGTRVEYHPVSGEPPVIVDGGLTTVGLPFDTFFGSPGGDSWQVPSPAFLDGLPRDPALLRERLYADSRGQGPSPDTEAMVFVADILRSGLVPADLRAALYRVIATVPGVEVTDDSLAIDGRPAVAIGRLAEDGTRQEIVIDPATGALIGERTVGPDGAVAGESRSTRTVVDAIPPDLIAAAEENGRAFPQG